MTGFKSFGHRTVTVKLSPGFTCIVGPNGAGKSNIIDALCFALGRLSKKTMRADKLVDLIFAGTKDKDPANKASVTLYFDNSEGIFPGGTDEFQITRVVRKNKSNKYKMNDKNATREQILNVLASANIDPDGSNQFVLQGKIVELTHMNTEERREFIEELIGLQKYDEMKEETMKELEKAERDLGQFEAIFKEVSSQLKKVEKEKDDALAWKELDKKINDLNAKLIALKISKLKEQEKNLREQAEQSNKDIEELEERINHQEGVLKQESLVLENIQREINQKEEEKNQINEAITKIKTQLSSNETKVSLAKETLEKLQKEKKELKELQTELEEDETYDSLIEEAQKTIDSIEAKIEQLKQEIEKAQQGQTELDNKINQKEEEKAQLKSEISELKQEISSKQASIKLLKENIQNNEEKKKNLKNELEELKGEGESIEEAINKTKQEESKVRNEIQEIKDELSEENTKRKTIEDKIASQQEEISTLNSQMSDFQSTLSSLNTEIKMHKQRREDLLNKKQSIQQRIENLGKGRNLDKIMQEMMQNRQEIDNALQELKKKMEEERFKYRKSEKDLELVKMKEESLISEIKDNKSKISNIDIKLNNYNKQLNDLKHRKKNLLLKEQDYENKLKEMNKKIKTLNQKKENILGRLESLNAEQERIKERINRAENEYERDKEDIKGILQILKMLTQNINISVESIKSNIQMQNAEAIEKSAKNFEGYLYDIIDIMKSVEEVSAHTEKLNQMKDQLSSISKTLSLFNENADESIQQLINRVKESVDVAVQDSTSNFDNFVQDLMEILENIHISLRKLTMSKSQDLYKQLEEINGNIKDQTKELNEITTELSELAIKKDHLENDLKLVKNTLKETAAKTNELNKNIEGAENKIEERKKIITQKEEKKETILQEIENLKAEKEEHWAKISAIQEKIDNKQKEREQLQQKYQDLEGIQTLFENIEEITDELDTLSKSIEENKEQVVQIEGKIQTLKNEKKSLENKLEDLSSERKEFWKINEILQEEIDTKNKELEKVLDKLRSLENIQRIIDSIEELTKENTQSREKISANENTIEELRDKIEKIQENVNVKQSEIDSLREEKTKGMEEQKEAQKKLNTQNKELQNVQITLNDLKKDKEREERIDSIKNEMAEKETQIKELTEIIQHNRAEIEKETEKKDEKQEELEKLLEKKDDSWEKQKNIQNTISDLKSELSMEKSKLNNVEQKTVIVQDQMDTFYQRSKDYGSLPQITDDLTEEELDSEIKDAVKKKEELEPVNLKAIKEYDVVKERFDEIDLRRQTIQRERKSILDAIDRIELEKTQTFMKAYHEINREFSRIFQKLSPGGSAKMILDRPDRPFEGGISIEARPRGKKIASLEILSGGEKTLVALSFIFAVQEFYPAPFYVMDEIDAALDGPNVHRVSMVIKEFAKQAQFLIISHREENIVNADRIYGVSMQESGITDIFSVDLEEEAKRLLETEEAKSKA